MVKRTVKKFEYDWQSEEGSRATARVMELRKTTNSNASIARLLSKEFGVKFTKNQIAGVAVRNGAEIRTSCVNSNVGNAERKPMPTEAERAECLRSIMENLIKW